MSNIAIIYSTTDGFTRKVAQYLQSKLECFAHNVSVIAIADFKQQEIIDFDHIILGASIRYGKHGKAVHDFFNNLTDETKEKFLSFFSINVVARKPEKNSPDTNPYLIKFFNKVDFKPELVAVFAGKINYKLYGLFDRTMIRFIMKITKGPTDLNTNVELIDWQKVDQLAQQIHQRIERV
ncbi:menaquinone-dependent protoporphyrinogen IX dehydrogenase [Thalassotalea aquiviva]|uniref:menaquinone-dependent protoporphyrinogen IX dehydrogenase n=1 Tax=Thalassotalea aquiviva TaxID=3242415 RepID=UPI00352A0EDD